MVSKDSCIKNTAEVTSLDILRIDLQQSLNQSAIDPRQLSSFQRILLTTDGTVTDILEAQFWEAIRIVKLFQKLVKTKTEIPYLELSTETEVLLRKVILRGKCSYKNYIYAESIVVPSHLDDNLKNGLLFTQKPIGQLMIETKLETFREILACHMEQAEDLGDFFGISTDAMLISRTYRVFANRKPIMLITEKFPETSF